MMKKALALLLSVLLLLSVVPTAGAITNFKDSKDVDFLNVEAVDIMSDLKIMAGFPEGDFRPNETLTRAQAAKILCCIMLGNDAANALPAGGSAFSDVPAAKWCNKYVEYCASQGIVAGVGGGRFDPDGELTGYAFGKMLLVALGADSAKLMGWAWQENTKAQLQAKKLDYGVTVDDKGISRQAACHLALNAIFDGEKENVEKTMAYKSFGVVRTPGSSDVSHYGRPVSKYTANDGEIYWSGVDKFVVTSPVYYVPSGPVKGGDVVEALGVEDIEGTQMIRYMNGAKSSTQKSTFFHTENTKTVAFTGQGVRFEVYYNIETAKYIMVHLYYNTEKVTEVTPAELDPYGNVVNPGIVTFENGSFCETSELTQEDVGNYALVYGYGTSRYKMSTPREAFRGNVVSGKLTAFDSKTGLSIDGKEYKYFFLLNDTSEMLKYIENGGKIGDEVKLLVDSEGLAYALWK